MNYFKFLLSLAVIPFFSLPLFAQTTTRIQHEQCGTMERLNLKLERNPALKATFEQQRTEFNRAVREGSSTLSSRLGNGAANRITYTIPVVFHVVLKNPASVTDAQILAQLDTLNKDFTGSNGDSVKIPSYFKSLFGKSGIQFCLAQRTPDEEATTGIERITTTQASFSNTTDAVKHASSSGADIWDETKYFNVWICSLSDNVLGYATFPDDGSADEQGVVIDYRSLPGGSLTNYNTGKTLSHESGHFFNLYHIWGDDGGACTGTDYVDDTPNQADASSGNVNGIKTDNCTPGGNGIMYQNFMDYTNDEDLVMFTNQQVTRMESAAAVYRSSLLTSNACQALVQHNYDVQLKTIDQPDQRLCSSSFTPAVTIKNRGVQTLTSLTITAAIDDNNSVTYNWTGSLAHSATASITLNNLTTATGNHTLTIYTSNPNHNADEDISSDTLSLNFQYYEPVSSVSESFEAATFPPTAWDIVNPDGSTTWKRVTGVAKTGTASAMINNFDDANIGERDDLRLPTANISSTVDSAFFSFQVAAAVYTDITTANNNWDTLEVLASTDCGKTYTSLYKRYGSSLVTRTAATTTTFTPTADEWRKDSLNLANYIGQGSLLLLFRNTNGNENNIYLDDVNLRTVTINPNLKSQGFLVTPNPTNGALAVQFYPQPTNLKSIQVYTIAGQKISEIVVNGQAGNYYPLDISNQPAGVYVVRALFSDRVITKKIIKQ